MVGRGSTYTMHHLLPSHIVFFYVDLAEDVVHPLVVADRSIEPLRSCVSGMAVRAGP